jgi:hypothetical protein
MTNPFKIVIWAFNLVGLADLVIDAARAVSVNLS